MTIEPLRKTARSHKRAKDDRAAEARWLGLCRYVDARDGMICRCCKRKIIVTIAAVVERREHHHVIPVSLGGQDTPQNVANICKGCHDERHVTRDLHITGNAEQALTFQKGDRVWQG